MTDKELLELAVKTVGFANWSYVGGSPGICVELGASRGDITSYWNPLKNDGDAFRLMVKFDLWQTVRCSRRVLGEEPDMYAATRRAIVRAAAEIGKAMS